jgi:hypothetical protein
MVVQQLQLIGVSGRQQIAPHGEHLAEFKKGEPQFFESFPHLLWRRPMFFAQQSSQKLMSNEHTQDFE